MGFTGSEEFIRLQFEEYLLALIASVRYKLFLEKQGSDPKALLADIGKVLFLLHRYDVQESTLVQTSTYL